MASPTESASSNASTTVKRRRNDVGNAYSADIYGVIHLNGHDFSSSEEFTDTIQWLRERHLANPNAVTACWLRLNSPIEFAMLLNIAIELGFVFHHAKGLEAVLGLWFHDTEPNSLPKGSTHTIGVGAVVVDSEGDGKILVVKEKLGPAKGKWKVVTGLVDLGENVSDAAIREVFEETGITNLTVCETIAFREMHNHVFGLSNMYFVCLMKATPGASLLPLMPCEKEIEAATWMSIEEYANLNYYPVGTLYHRIGQASVDAARRLIQNKQAHGALAHHLLAVDKAGTRVESLWV